VIYPALDSRRTLPTSGVVRPFTLASLGAKSAAPIRGRPSAGKAAARRAVSLCCDLRLEIIAAIRAAPNLATARQIHRALIGLDLWAERALLTEP
jgi:hypothetical protein